MDHKIIITIDGPAASGKGTIAQIIAEKLDLEYFDSGLIYRKIAFEVIKNHLEVTNIPKILDLIQSIDFDLQSLKNPDLRQENVSNIASKIAAILEVRQQLTDFQRQIVNKSSKGLVADGRDMGTVIFPEANYKFFLTADVQERAQRRYNQLQHTNNNAIFAEVLKELNDRDTRDASRNAAPLVPALDAVVIDSTHYTIEQVVEMIIAKIN